MPLSRRGFSPVSLSFREILLSSVSPPPPDFIASLFRAPLQIQHVRPPKTNRAAPHQENDMPQIHTALASNTLRSTRHPIPIHSFRSFVSPLFYCLFQLTNPVFYWSVWNVAPICKFINAASFIGKPVRFHTIIPRIVCVSKFITDN